MTPMKKMRMMILIAGDGNDKQAGKNDTDKQEEDTLR
jgi:hypothetical protein